MMERLTAANIKASLRHLPDGRGSTTNEYAIFVAEEEAERAANILEFDHIDYNRERADYSRSDSIVSCPRCELKKISFPDDHIILIAFLSLPLLGLPAIAYFIYSKQRGSKKRCESCHHEWRSKP
jgi:hypothetical protein